MTAARLGRCHVAGTTRKRQVRADITRRARTCFHRKHGAIGGARTKGFLGKQVTTKKARRASMVGMALARGHSLLDGVDLSKLLTPPSEPSGSDNEDDSKKEGKDDSK